MDAKEKLADYSLRAPFDGTITGITIKKGDAVTSGTSIATLLTPQKIAEIALNEVDASKISLGQKATLSFDAVDGLSLTGKVSEIDALGTVSQGVVTYTVKITFDAEDARVKPGMSVSAAIITDVKQNVLMVPNSAVKLSGDARYVEVPTVPVATDATANVSGIVFNEPPREQSIQMGISNDTSTEIISGLQEGDQIIVRTITPTTGQTTQTPTFFGGNQARGGNFRVVR
jgi:HlyD family secretion protein